MNKINFIKTGQFELPQIAAALRTSAEEIAMIVRSGKDAVQRRARISPNKKQRRLRQLVEVPNKVEPCFGSALMVYAKYRSESLPCLDGWTAMQMVQEGKAQQVPEFVDAGVFARSALAETWDAEMS